MDAEPVAVVAVVPLTYSNVKNFNYYQIIKLKRDIEKRKVKSPKPFN